QQLLQRIANRVCDLEIEIDLHSGAVEIEIQEQHLAGILAARHMGGEIDRDLVLPVIFPSTDEGDDVTLALAVGAAGVLQLPRYGALDLLGRGFAVEEVARSRLHGRDDLRRHGLVAEPDLPDRRKLEMDLLHDLEDRLLLGLYRLKIEDHYRRLE